ncbi:MAG TPA: hypothetical protein PLK43_06945 [Caldisericia bacterium]|jgi:hypothetical protein|nr:MAG: hypothetical protein BWX90_00665 [bacterium ADurb.Bin132]HNY61989.1 hypothetical protein [Caldisericia bacterium]HOC79965.1 hypothetical protein [Caldisericia bacterium]HOG71092.1 hypothetical protein [Caldisericia bacterium]HPM44796.1 hypothetical protein [Caldisericia bacterium]
MVLFEEKYFAEKNALCFIFSIIVFILCSYLFYITILGVHERIFFSAVIELLALFILFLAAIHIWYTVKIDEETLSFGFIMSMGKVPLKEIKQILFITDGSILRPWGHNWRQMVNGTCFLTGYDDIAKVENDNGEAKYFSIKNTEEARKVLTSLLSKEKVI